MLLPVERVFRRRSSVCQGSTRGSVEDIEEDLGEGSDEEDARGCFAWTLNSLMEAMFLMRKVDRAAAQSTKAKVAPFHNFILKRGGALKLCREMETKKGQSSDSLSNLKNRYKCDNPCMLLEFCNFLYQGFYFSMRFSFYYRLF